MTSLWRLSWVSILCLLLTTPLTHTQTYEGECQLDLVFVVDGSVSVGPTNFRTLLNTIVNYVSKLPVALEAVQVGVVAFSTIPDVVTMSGDMAAIRTGVNNLVYDGRHTNTHLALQMADSLLHSTGRPSVPKVVIILMTRPSKMRREALLAASKLRNDGATLWAVGIGNRYDITELLAMSGNIDQMALTRRYTSLPSNIDLRLSCEVIFPPPVVTSTKEIKITPTSTQDLGHTETASKTLSLHVTDHATLTPTSTNDLGHSETFRLDTSHTDGVVSMTTATVALPNTETTHRYATTATVALPNTETTHLYATTATVALPDTATTQLDATTATVALPNTATTQLDGITITVALPNTETTHLYATTATVALPNTETTHLYATTATVALPNTATTQLDATTAAAITVVFPNPETTHLYATTATDALPNTATTHIYATTATVALPNTETTHLYATTATVALPNTATTHLYATTATVALPNTATTHIYATTATAYHSIDPTSVTVEPSTTASPKDRVYPDLLCSKSVEVEEGLWLASHPTECDKFIQCHYLEEDHLTTSVRLCPRGLFWSKTKSSCVDPKEAHCMMDPCRNSDTDSYSMDGGCSLYWRCVKGVSKGENCKRGYAYTPIGGCVPSPRCKAMSISETCQSEGSCQRIPLPDKRGYHTRLTTFPGDWITTPCLYGATFDLASCSCVASMPFASNCQHINKVEWNLRRQQNDTNREETSTKLIYDPRSTRPTSLRFRYKPSPSNNDTEGLGEILLRSSKCPAGAIFVLWEQDLSLEARLFSRDGYYLKASLSLAGINETEWRSVQLRYTLSGDISLMLKSGPLTFTNYIRGGLYVPLSLCGWDAGLPGSFAEQVSPFQGDMEEIYISRCYDHGF